MKKTFVILAACVAGYLFSGCGQPQGGGGGGGNETNFTPAVARPK